jgi:hypothetical protein
MEQPLDGYVSPEEGRKLFPDDAADIVYCRVCGAALLVRPGERPECERHESSTEKPSFSRRAL